jgi:hypothetical protein
MSPNLLNIIGSKINILNLICVLCALKYHIYIYNITLIICQIVYAPVSPLLATL